MDGAETAAVEVGPGGTRSRRTHPTPPPPVVSGLQGRKEEGFHPLRLLKPSNTPQGRRIIIMITSATTLTMIFITIATLL